MAFASVLLIVVGLAFLLGAIANISPLDWFKQHLPGGASFGGKGAKSGG